MPWCSVSRIASMGTMRRPFPSSIAEVLALAVLALVAQACSTPTGDGPDARRARIKEMDGKILTSIYQAQPESIHLVDSAAGYATASTVVAGGPIDGLDTGEGMATNRASGKETFLTVHRLDTASGAGVGALQVLMIFKKQATYEAFLEKGWTLGGGAQGTVKAFEAGELEQQPGRLVAPETDPIVYEITGAVVSPIETVDGLRIEVDDTLD